MEMLSEHQCQGWLEGYLLTGRHGFFSCYEAFIHIIDAMFNQHAKWLKVCNDIEWRRPIASLNYLLSSHVWRQDHNGFSHQDPGFIDHVINKKAEVVRVYLPPDANCLLSVTDHCLRSRNYVNVVVAGKQPAPQWLTMDQAIKHCTAGLGIWEWASNDRGSVPDVVMACCGDVPTLETLAAVDLLRRHAPELKIRVINIVDLMKLQPTTEHPHGLSDRDFDDLFTTDKPIIFAFHGYPWLIHRLTYRRHGHHNIHVRGYKEEGTTTTPFDMCVLNDLDRFHLVGDVIDRVPQLGRAPPTRSRRSATSLSSTSSTSRVTAMTCRTSRAGPGDTRPWRSAPVRRRPTMSEAGPRGTPLLAAIFDVDGVLVASPHERAWREALAGYADPARFTTEFYQARVAGKPRLDGARAALEGLGVPDAAARAAEYARKKQALIDRLIAEGSFEAFPDAVRLRRCLARGRLAAGAGVLVEERRRHAAPSAALPDGRPLMSIFDADLSGTDVPRGKPDPALFLLAAKALEGPTSALPGGGGRAGRHRGRARRRHGFCRHRAAWRRGFAAGPRGRSGRHQPRSGRCGRRPRRHIARSARQRRCPLMRDAIEPTRDPCWVLTHEGYNVLTENA